MSHTQAYYAHAAAICGKLDHGLIDTLVGELKALRNAGGRLFILGVGGSAANCGHAVNDFRKLCGIEAYAPTDNVAELTARTNDEGWDTVFSEWIKVSRGTDRDALLVLSVGGGNAEKNVSPNLVKAIDEAKRRSMKVFGIVGRDGGYTKKQGDVVVVIPTVADNLITPLSEAFQGLVWHGLVSHPELQAVSNKWEGLTKP